MAEKKIIAVQVNPETQESPINENEWMTQVVYRGYGMRWEGNSELKRLLDAFEEWVDDIYETIQDKSMTDSDKIIQIKQWMDLDKNEGSSDLSVWNKACDEYDYCDHGREYLAVLHAVTGKKYEIDTIHGSSQSDWDDLYHPAKMTKEELDRFEMEFFNEGTAWVLDSPDGTEPDVNYIYTGSLYDKDAVKQEIADATEVNPDEVTLMIIDGYRPVYVDAQ